MDIQKQGKEQPQVIDINEAMNSLLTKVAEAVAKPEGATTKDLQEISNQLSELREVDKTTPYTLLPETKEKLQKAAQSLQMPESFVEKTKEELPTPEKTFKLPSEETPKTEAEARKKYNDIVNSNLDKTIKTIEEVIAAATESEKSDNEIQSLISQQAQKIANQILIGLLGRRLKNFTEVSIAAAESTKETNEFELNQEKAGKSTETAAQSEVENAQQEQQKSSSEFDADLPAEGKTLIPTEEQRVNYLTDRTSKQVQRIGQFPDFRAKTQEETPAAAQEALKQQQELIDATKDPLKEIQELDYQIDGDNKFILETPRAPTESLKEQQEAPRAPEEAQKDIQGVEGYASNKTEKDLADTDAQSYNRNKGEKEVPDVPSTGEESEKEALEAPDPEDAQEKQQQPFEAPSQEELKSAQELLTSSQEAAKSLQEVTSAPEESNKPIVNSGPDAPENLISDNIQTSVDDNKTSKSNNEPPTAPEEDDKPPVLQTYGIIDGKPDIVFDEQIQSAGQSFNVNNPDFNPNAPVTEENSPSLTLSDKFTPDKQEVYGRGPVPETEFTKDPLDVDENNEFTTATGRKLPGSGEESDYIKDEQDILTASDADGKSNNNLGIPGQEDEKPPTADEWWESIGNSRNAVQQSNTYFGVNFGNAGGWIGDALSFFAISAADVTRYANTVRRTINTEANAQAIMNGQTSGFFGFGGEGRGLNQLEQARANAQLEDGEYINRKGSYSDGQPFIEPNNTLSNQYEGTTAVPLEPSYQDGHALGRKPSASSPQESERIAGQSDAFINTATIRQLAERFVQPWSASGVPTNKPKFSANASSDVENWLSIRAGNGNTSTTQGYRNKPYRTPGEDDAYRNNYRSRTTQIVGVPGTGFLKIYSKRALDFSSTQRNNENFIIPFQFEPEISNDSKSADYSQVSTLGRSQSAQVYRKSTERTITLTLNYLVTGPSQDSEYERNAQGLSYRSKSAQGMELWTEEYIYAYIIRNLRNLVLPNLRDDTRFRLAPPIVQVWYGGIDPTTASSTGYETDPNNSRGNEIYPTFRTNWHTSDGQQKTFRSLWVTKDVSIEYKAGKVNTNTRNNLWVTATIQLTEIAPSVVANEVFLWNSLSV